MPIQKDDLLESVIGQRPSHVEHLFDERRIIRVDRSRKIHHVPGVTVRDMGKDQYLVGEFPSGSICDPARADQIHVQRQVVSMLLDRTTRKNANLAKIDGVIDFRPGQFLVSIFRSGAGHSSFSIWNK